MRNQNYSHVFFTEEQVVMEKRRIWMSRVLYILFVTSCLLVAFFTANVITALSIVFMVVGVASMVIAPIKFPSFDGLDAVSGKQMKEIVDASKKFEEIGFIVNQQISEGKKLLIRDYDFVRNLYFELEEKRVLEEAKAELRNLK